MLRLPFSLMLFVVLFATSFYSCNKNAGISISADKSYESTLQEIFSSIEADQDLKNNLWSIEVRHKNQIDFQIIRRQNLPVPPDDTFGYALMISDRKEMFEVGGQLSHFAKSELVDFFRISYGFPTDKSSDTSPLYIYTADMVNDQDAIIRLSKRIVEEVYLRNSRQVNFKIDTID